MILYLFIHSEKPIDVNGTMVYIRLVKSLNYIIINCCAVNDLLLLLMLYRGSLILEENIKALLTQGMSSAERIILTGCSGVYA